DQARVHETGETPEVKEKRHRNAVEVRGAFVPRGAAQQRVGKRGTRAGDSGHDLDGAQRVAAGTRNPREGFLTHASACDVVRGRFDFGDGRKLLELRVVDGWFARFRSWRESGLLGNGWLGRRLLRRFAWRALDHV